MDSDYNLAVMKLGLDEAKASFNLVIDSIDGTENDPIIIEGYNTTRGDQPTGTNRPTNDRNSTAGDALVTNTEGRKG